MNMTEREEHLMAAQVTEDMLLARWGEFVDPCMDEILEAGGVRVVPVEDEGDLLALGSDVDAVFVRTPNYLSAATIGELPRLAVIAVPGAGLEVVDVQGATDRGVPVVHGGGIGALAVAEWVVGAMIWLARDTGVMQRSVEEGAWSVRKDPSGRVELRSLAIGVLGYGEIGSTVARLVAAFGSRAVVADVAPHAKQRAEADGFDVIAPDVLPGQCDILTIHAQTQHGAPPLVGREQLRAMRSGGYIVNTSRGTALDYEALVDMLDSDHIAGAALDVFPQEPPSPRLIERLRTHDRVLMAPHQAGLTQQSAEEMTRVVARAIVDVLGGGAPANCANPSTVRTRP